MLLTYAGQRMGFSNLHTTTACTGTVVANTWMISSVNLRDAKDCWRWFQCGALMMGMTVSAGLLAEYVKAAGLVQGTGWIQQLKHVAELRS